MNRPVQHMRRPTGGDNPEFVLREFDGMNNIAAREAIGENEFYWLENLIPIAPGNLSPVNSPTASLQTFAESGSPSYATTFNVNGTDYAFVVWSNSGNGYVVNLSSFVATKIFNSTLTSGGTAATQWSNKGLLIIDATGYFDWNITTASTLTTQNNSAASTTLGSASSIAGGSNLAQNLSVTGSGGTFQTFYQVSSVTLNAAGTGYVVGDVLLLTDGSPVTPASVTVTSIGAGGAISGLSLTSGGSYPGPTTSTAVPIGPAGSTFGGGTGGTGATLKVQIIAAVCKILTPGSGYTTGDSIFDQFPIAGPSFRTLDFFTITASGVVAGTSIASYAGRVWIGNNRTVSFTDVGSYNSFGGAGGAFTINDTYLHSVITALCAANNYLYIFGDDSIDALSNVTVTAGVTSFSRINLTASLGTSQPTSVFSYFRTVAFYHASGFYLLSGATPEKISEKITGIIQGVVAGTKVYGCNVLVEGELCAAFLITFTDTFTQPAPGTQRSLVALFFRGKWWMAALAPYVPGAIVSIPASGVQTLFFFAGPALYKAFTGNAIFPWLLKTRLWDAGTPLREKQALNAAIGCLPTTSPLSMQLAVDTEKGTTAPVSPNLPTVTWVNQAGQTVTWVNNAGQPVSWQTSPQYFLSTMAVDAGGSQYLGLTVTGNTNVSRLDMLGLLGKQDRDMLR